METFTSLLPSAGTIAGVVVALFIVNRFFDRRDAAVAGHRFRSQTIMIALTAVCALVIIMVLPIGDARRGQLLALIGILLSAAIALSSTTVLGNAMAGVMLRVVRNFRMGDFIRTGEHFGRVSERGLFHTEIQTEDRELTTLPNLYLVTHPVTTLRTSGTIVSATVSLGYDLPRARVEELLLEAARGSGLGDPFVQVLKLGDFSVTYRVAGLLKEVKRFVSTRSKLRAAVMEKLHAGGVEIVSPTFMNTRALSEKRVFIPAPSRKPVPAEPATKPEDVVFDKAEQAESLETLRAAYREVVEEIKVLEEKAKKTPEGPEREKARSGLPLLELRKERLEKTISHREAKVDDA